MNRQPSSPRRPRAGAPRARPAASASATPSASSRRSPDTIAIPGRTPCSAQLRATASQQAGGQVRGHDVGHRRGFAAQVGVAQLDLDAVRAGVAARSRRSPPGPRRRRAPARTRASRPRSPARPSRSRGRRTSPAGQSRLQQQLEAHPGGGMRAGAERAARVDHDLLDAAAVRRLLPGRAHVQAARRSAPGSRTASSARPSRPGPPRRAPRRAPRRPPRPGRPASGSSPRAP